MKTDYRAFFFCLESWNRNEKVTKEERAAILRMTEEKVRVQKPIGENNHYVQLFSGYLQIEKPNTDFVLKFACQKIVNLLHILPDILYSAVDADTAEEDESSYEKEMILGQETLTITARTKKMRRQF